MSITNAKTSLTLSELENLSGTIQKRMTAQ